MSGKRSRSESTSTTGSAQPWANPYAQQAVGQVQSVFNQNQPGLQALTDMTRNDVVNPLLAKFQGGMGAASAAQGYNADVLAGKYMGGGNPYLQNIMATVRGDIMNDENSKYALAGRYGSDAHGNGLGRAVAAAENNLLYNDYNNERSRMAEAATNAQRDNTADIANLLQSIAAGAQLPYTGSSNLADSLGALFAGGTEKSKSVGAKPGLLDYLAQAAGNAASAFGGGGG